MKNRADSGAVFNGEENLERRRALNRAVARSLGDGVIAVDGAGIIIFINPAAEELLNCSDEQCLGKNFHDLVHDDEDCDDPRRCALWQGLVTGAEIHSQDDEFRCCDSQQVSVAYTLTPFRKNEVDEGGVIVFRDVSNYRQMQARLLFTDRMVAVGTLAAGLAHEINNPLAIVQSNVEYARRAISAGGLCSRDGGAKAFDEAAVCEALGDAMDGINRMSLIVAGMQAFTGQGDGRTVVDVGECLQDALIVTRGEVSRHAELEVRGELLEMTYSNTARLTHVFVNLLLNAAQAIADTGRRGEIIVNCSHGEDTQVVEIADDGIGIPEDLQRKIFDPFFTTREAGKGTGLGLFICRSTLEEAGGSISLESREGVGTTFRVVLPKLKKKAEAVGMDEADGI